MFSIELYKYVTIVTSNPNQYYTNMVLSTIVYGSSRSLSTIFIYIVVVSLNQGTKRKKH
jgi:hypothetical protein